MKFKISSETLHNNLQQVSRVLPVKNNIPILENVLFDVDGKTLTLTGSDGETRLTTRLELTEAVDQKLAFAVNSRLMLEALRELVDQTLDIDVDPETFLVEVKYSTGNFSFKASNGDVYPAVQSFEMEPEVLKMPQSVFLCGVNYTIYSTAKEDVRPIMTGIHIDAKPEYITFVGTDGFQLAIYKNSNVRPGIEKAITFQRTSARMLTVLLSKEDDKELEIKIYDNYVQIVTDEIDMICPLLEGKYPKYESVIPKNNDKELIIDRLLFLSALRRVSIFSNQALSLVSLDIKPDVLDLQANDKDFASAAYDQLSVSYNGAPMSVAYRSPHLINTLTNLSSENIVIKLGDKVSPALISPQDNEEGEEVASLIMPLMR